MRARLKNNLIVAWLGISAITASKLDVPSELTIGRNSTRPISGFAFMLCDAVPHKFANDLSCRFVLTTAKGNELLPKLSFNSNSIAESFIEKV